jgi:hypothetical protein
MKKASKTMRGAVLYGPGDVRFEERVAPTIIAPTDAIIRMSATCICGSETYGLTAASKRPTGRRRWGTSIAASSRRSAARSGRSSPANSSSARSSPPITLVRTAVRATRRPASTGSLSVVRRRRYCASRSRTAPWCPRSRTGLSPRISE